MDGSTRAARHAGSQQAIAETPNRSPITPTYVIGWSLSTDQIARLIAGASAAASPRARTISDCTWSAEYHCVVVTYTASVLLAASDSCFTSPTTPTMVYHGTSLLPRCSRWPMG